MSERDSRVLIDVNVPFYGAVRLLGRCLRSVQDARKCNVLVRIRVFDDCSPEPASTLVQRFPEVEIVRGATNVGMLENWNRCLKEGEADFVQVLHYDDTVLPGYYEAVASAILAYSDIGLAFCRSTAYQSSGNPIGYVRAFRNRMAARVVKNVPLEWYPGGDAAVRCVLGGVVCSGAVVARRAIADIGPFSSDFPYSTDEDYWPRLAARWGVVFMDAPLVAYGYHGDNYHYRTWMEPRFWNQYVRLKERRLAYLSQVRQRDIAEMRSALARLAVGIALRLVVRGSGGMAARYLERAQELDGNVVDSGAYRRVKRLSSLGLAGRIVGRIFCD